MTTLTIPPGKQTLARFANGDPAAFAKLVQEHQSMVYSIAYHFLHDRGRAEEVAQDVFLRLYQHLASIKSEDHLVFWLRKVTCRRSIDEVRKSPKALPSSLEDIGERAAEFPDVDPLLFQGLRRMVASLPEEARAVIVLRYQEELEPAEIAEILAVPVNTVKSRLQRSLEMLRQKFQRWAGDVRQ